MTPEGWSRRAMSEMVERITTGVSVNSQGRPRAAGELGVLKTSAVTYGVFRPDENKAVEPEEVTRAREHPRAGCVLFSRMNTVSLVGASAYVAVDRNDLVLPDRIWQLRPGPKVAGRWLHALLSSPGMRARLSEAASGTSGSMKNISQEKLLALEVLAPPLPEQRKIAAILSSMDDAIGATQAVIGQLGVVKKAMMAELLTRGLPGRHMRFTQTELGEIPDGWMLGRLGTVTEDITYGLTVRPAYVRGGIPLISTKECRDGCIDYDAANTISAEDFAKLRTRTLPRVGDALITKTGTVGRVARFRPGAPTCAISQNVALVRPKESRVSPAFLELLLAGPHMKSQIDLATNALAVRDLQLGSLRQFLVAVPPLDEQLPICECVEHIAILESTERSTLNAAIQLRKALMSVLLTGEVRVKPDEEAA